MRWKLNICIKHLSGRASQKSVRGSCLNAETHEKDCWQKCWFSPDLSKITDEECACDTECMIQNCSDIVWKCTSTVLCDVDNKQATVNAGLSTKQSWPQTLCSTSEMVRPEWLLHSSTSESQKGWIRLCVHIRVSGWLVVAIAPEPRIQGSLDVLFSWALLSLRPCHLDPGQCSSNSFTGERQGCSVMAGGILVNWWPVINDA